MNNAKRLACILTAGCLFLASLAGCSGAPGTLSSAQSTGRPGSTATSGSTAAATNGSAQETYTIGAVQMMEHKALDAAYEGFVAALADSGYVDGENIELDFQNAQGDVNNLSTIGDRFVSQNKDLILAITTDAAQSMAGKTTDIPILATAVTSYTTAGLVDSDEAPGGNVSGTCDMNPVAAQIQMIQDMLPDVGTIGLVYNSGEDNSVLQADMAKTQIEAMGLQWEEVTVTNVNDVQQVLQGLVGKCDALYIPTDNTLASAMATVHGVTGPAQLPTFCGESNMVMEGGLATMGINYYDLGYKTGLMAIEVMGGADVAAMPIRYADSSDEVVINALVAREIGYEIPDAYQAYAIEPGEE